MNLPRPKIEDTWIFVIGCGIALMSGIFWREVFPAIWRYLSYAFQFIRWGLDELDTVDFHKVRVMVYTPILMGVVWLWGYSAGRESKGKE